MFLSVTNVELVHVMRQLHDSGILYNATELRKSIASGEAGALPEIKFAPVADICCVKGEELIETIEGCYGEVGVEETIILCRSNKRANVYNEGIRRRILYREEELNRGDMSFKDDEADTVLRMFRVAKSCGCKFYCGTDAHHPKAFVNARDVFERAIDLLGLTENDKFHIGE